jgi:hypothetical protein
MNSINNSTNFNCKNILKTYIGLDSHTREVLTNNIGFNNELDNTFKLFYQLQEVAELPCREFQSRHGSAAFFYKKRSS